MNAFTPQREMSVYFPESLDSCFASQIRSMAKKMVRVKAVPSWAWARPMAQARTSVNLRLMTG